MRAPVEAVQLPEVVVVRVRVSATELVVIVPAVKAQEADDELGFP